MHQHHGMTGFLAILFVLLLIPISRGYAAEAVTIQDLSAGDPQVRCQAVRALMGSREQATVLAVLALGKDPDTQVRATVLALLPTARREAAWNQPIVTDILIRGLQHTDPTVRLTAIRTLRELSLPQVSLPESELMSLYPDSRLINVLVNTLRDSDAAIREIALQTLVHIEGKAVAPALLPLLSAGDAETRLMAIMVLKEYADPLFIPLLLTASADTDSRVANSAREGLERIGAPAIPALLAALPAVDFNLQQPIVQVLIALQAREAVNPALQLLDSPDDSTRVTAATLLGGLKDLRAIPALQAHLTDKASWVRQQCAESLGTLQAKSAIPILLAQLHTESDWHTQESIVSALGVLQAREAVQDVLPFLQHDRIDMRYTAVVTLGRLQNPQAIAPLRAMLQGKLPPRPTPQPAPRVSPMDDNGLHWIMEDTVHLAIIRVLVKLGEPGAVELLLQASKGGLQQREVLEALSAIDNPAATPALINALREKDPRVVEAAGMALGRISTREATQALLDAYTAEAGNSSRMQRGLELLHGSACYEPLAAFITSHPERSIDMVPCLARAHDLRAILLLLSLLPRNNAYEYRLISDALYTYGIAGISVVPPLFSVPQTRDAAEKICRLLLANVPRDSRPGDVLAYRAAAYDMLAPFIKAEDPAVRAAVCAPIAETQRPKAAQLLAGLLRDNDAQVRQQAAAAFAILDDHGMDALKSLLTGEQVAARQAAMQAILAMSDFSRDLPVCEAACTATRDTDREVRLLALRSLEKLRYPRAIYSVYFSPTDDEELRSQTAKTLGAIGDKVAVDRLLPALQDPSADVCTAVAFALGETGDPRVSAALLPLLDHPSLSVQMCAAWGLSKTATAAAADSLMAKIGKTTTTECLAPLLLALGHTGDPRAVGLLLHYLRHEVPNVCECTLHALAEINSPESLAALQEQAKHPETPEGRLAQTLLER